MNSRFDGLLKGSPGPAVDGPGFFGIIRILNFCSFRYLA